MQINWDKADVIIHSARRQVGEGTYLLDGKRARRRVLDDSGSTSSRSALPLAPGLSRPLEANKLETRKLRDRFEGSSQPGSMGEGRKYWRQRKGLLDPSQPRLSSKRIAQCRPLCNQAGLLPPRRKCASTQYSGSHNLFCPS